MKTIHEDREYDLFAKDDLPNLKDNLISRGFDGYVYSGISHPVRRQRTTKSNMFYRNAKTGLFMAVL